MNFHDWNRQKNLWLREQKRRVALALFDWKNPNIFTPQETKNLRKILILRNDNKLGDMIVTSVVIRELKKQLPQTEISVLAGPTSAQLLAHNPYVSHIYIGENKLCQMFRLGRQLAKENFDLFVDFDRKNSAATLLLLRLLQPKFAFGFNRGGIKLYNISVPLEFDAFHITQWHAKLFETLGLRLTNAQYDLFLPEEETRETEQFLSSYKPFIAFNAFAASKHRSFSWEQVCSIVKAFPKHNFVLLGKSAQIHAFTDGKTKPSNLILLPYSFGLYHSLVALKQSILLITPDTMYVHAAVALKKPQICVYKGDSCTVWGPNDPQAHPLFSSDDLNRFPISTLSEAIQKTLAEIDSTGGRCA